MPLSVEARAKVAFAAFLLVLGAAAGAWYLFVRQQHVVYEIRSPDSVSGLITGSPVEFHGVEVGKVDEVQLVDAHHVRILVEVRKDAPVTTATRATITGRGLAARGFTGYVYVSLDEAAPDGRPLAAQPGSSHAIIASAPSQGVSLDSSISQLNESVQSAMTLLHDVLDAQTVASLKQSVRNLDEVSSNLAANNARLRAVLANAEATTAQMPPLLHAGTDMLRGVQTQVLPQAQDSLARLNGTISSADETLRSIRTELLPQAQRTVTRLDQLSGSLADSADLIRRNPALLVRGTAAARPGPGEAQ
jgi:phospholipid/cholesterol/gamma-HCH transport system substrate-binding protein